MYFLVPLLAPLVLLGVMGMAWIEDHLLPPAEPPPQAQAVLVPARDPPPAELAERPERPRVFPGSARGPAPGVRHAARTGQGADHRRPRVRVHHPATLAPATAAAAGPARLICPGRHQPAEAPAVDGDATVPDLQASDPQDQPPASSVGVSAELAVPHTSPAEA